MKIIIETVQHLEQRYNTCGDWQYDASGNLIVRVSEMLITKGHWAVGIHEVVEALLCAARGITQDQVDEFDKEWANNTIDNSTEPGDHPKAPYHREHCIATGVERILVAELGINWQDYEDELTAMTIAYDMQKEDEEDAKESN